MLKYISTNNIVINNPTTIKFSKKRNQQFLLNIKAFQKFEKQINFVD